MVNISKIIQYNVIGKLTNHVIVFFINICIVRLLGAAESGLYFNELYALNFVALVLSLGVDFSTISFLAQNEGLLKALRTKMLYLSFFFAALLIALTLFGFPAIIQNFFSQPLLAIILFCIGNLLLIFYQGLLSALKKFNQQNITLIITNAIFLLFLVFKMWENNGFINFKLLVMANAILFITQGLIMLFLSYQAESTGTPAELSWSSFVKPGIYLMLASLTYFFFLRVDNFFVEKYCDPVALGSYIQCGKVGQYFIYFSSIISSTMIPFIANEANALSYKNWRAMMKPYLVLLSLAALAVIATGSFLFPFLFGNDFSQMYPIMLILLPGFVALGMLTLLNSVYIGKGNLKKILIGDIGGSVVVILLDVLLIPVYGVYAAAAISSLCYILVFLFLLSSLKKQFDTQNSQTGIFKIK
jgi:O-antigen/teichoic acid export membrane protein